MFLEYLYIEDSVQKVICLLNREAHSVEDRLFLIQLLFCSDKRSNTYTWEYGVNRRLLIPREHERTMTPHEQPARES